MRIIPSAGENPRRICPSKALSKLAESLTFSSRLRNHSPAPNCARNSPSRERVHRRLPLMVLISPLCPTNRNGCASDQLGRVLVENR